MEYKQKICLGHNEIPETSKYFKEELIKELLVIPNNKPDIERVLDVLVWPEIENIKLVDTQVGKSIEGQNLSGVKLIVELKLKEKLTYVACEPTQSVHATYFETIKSIFVVLPREIDGKDICDLVRADKIQVIPYVEAVKSRMLDTRTVHRCVMLFVDVNFC